MCLADEITLKPLLSISYAGATILYLLRRFFTGGFIIKYTQGISLVVFAPTLLDIAHQLNVGVGVLSVIFLVRAIGAVIGTVGSGILMDHYSRLQYAQLCIVLVGGIAGMCSCV